MLQKLVYSKRRGAALPVALMVLFVLSILGTALWQYASTDVLHASRQEKSLQAYYVARAGVETVSEYIIRNPENIENIQDFVQDLIDDGASDSEAFGRGVFSVEVTRDNITDVILIRGDATVDGVPGTATLVLAESVAPLSPTPLELFFQYAIYSLTDLTLGGNVRVWTYPSSSELGEVAAGQRIIRRGAAGQFDDVGEDGIRNEYVVIDPPFVAVEFPDLPNRGSISMSGGQTTISEDGYYSSITLSGGTLTFATGGHDLQIRVGSFQMSGNNTKVVVSGGGRVLFYVDDEYRQTGGTVNDWGTGAGGQGQPIPAQFIMLGPNTVHFGGNASFVGYIYSTETVDGFGVAGTPNIYGAVIFGSASDFGNARVHYVDPNDPNNPPIGGLPGDSGEVSYIVQGWR